MFHSQLWFVYLFWSQTINILLNPSFGCPTNATNYNEYLVPLSICRLTLPTTWHSDTKMGRNCQLPRLFSSSCGMCTMINRQTDARLSYACTPLYPAPARRGKGGKGLSKGCVVLFLLFVIKIVFHYWVFLPLSWALVWYGQYLTMLKSPNTQLSSWKKITNLN